MTLLIGKGTASRPSQLSFPGQLLSAATWDPAVQMSQAPQKTSLSSLSFTVWDLLEPLARGCCRGKDREVRQGLKFSSFVSTQCF